MSRRSRWPERTLEERFWEKVDRRGSDDCWPWTAYVSPNGYGRFTISAGRMARAHRLAYELAVGPIPEGKLLDHVCHNEHGTCRGVCEHRRCCNPRHLRPATAVENGRDGRAGRYASAITHCKHGHEFTAENIYWYVKRGIRCRQCRTCVRLRAAEVRARRKAA